MIPRPVQMPPPAVEAEESAYSAICSVYHEEGRPTQWLVEMAIEAVERGMKVVEVRGAVWPGDELCLIGGLVLAMRPRLVVMVGSERGREVIEKYLPEGGRVEVAELERIDPEAELVIVNGPGDGEFEARVLERLGARRSGALRLVMLNDTRRWGMLKFWREIRFSKLDMTSFGRWTGTGLVELE